MHLNPGGINLSTVPYINVVLVCFAVNSIVICAILLLKRFLPPQIPLYYGLPRSGEQVANSSALITPTLASTAVVVINTLLAILIKEDFLKKTLVLISAIGVFLSVLTTAKILFLVGSF